LRRKNRKDHKGIAKKSMAQRDYLVYFRIYFFFSFFATEELFAALQLSSIKLFFKLSL